MNNGVVHSVSLPDRTLMTFSAPSINVNVSLSFSVEQFWLNSMYKAIAPNDKIFLNLRSFIKHIMFFFWNIFKINPLNEKFDPNCHKALFEQVTSIVKY